MKIVRGLEQTYVLLTISPSGWNLEQLLEVFFFFSFLVTVTKVRFSLLKRMRILRGMLGFGKLETTRALSDDT